LANSYELCLLEYLQGLDKDINKRDTSAQLAAIKGVIHTREKTRHGFQTICQYLKDESYKGMTSIEASSL
jgi:hypothetical protein